MLNAGREADSLEARSGGSPNGAPIGKFNSKDTDPRATRTVAVVAKGSMVFVRGQIGQDFKTLKSVGVGDVAAQTERVMKNMAGSSLQNICKIMIYIIESRYRSPVYHVVGRHLKGVFPVSTGTVVSALARLEWLVEVDAMAVVPD